MTDFNDPAHFRDKGLDFLQKGKEYFNKHQRPDERQKGYELYKKGLDYMLKYMKAETHPGLAGKVRDNFKVWMQEAKTMENTLFQGNAANNTQNNNTTQNTNNTNTRPSQPASNNQGSSSQPDFNYAPPYNPNQTNGLPYQPYQPPKKDSPRNVPDVKKSTKKVELKEGDSEATKLQNNLEAAIVTEKPNIRWEDIAGLEQAKKSLQEAVIYPIKFPNLFVGMRTPWKGILLYGPPGTGKTYLAKACATEADATFFSVSSADITSKYVGESEKLIKTLFGLARSKKPAIIFIDEIDSLLSARSDNENEASRRVKTEFLVQMQGVGHDDTGILVLGATNIPWALDSAVRRRFEKRIYIPLPDYSARESLLTRQLTQTPHELQEDDARYLAERTDGYSCADMNILIRDASYQPLRKCQNATHFRAVGNLPSGKPIYQPCPPSHPQGQRMAMFDISGDQLTLPVINMDDFEISLLKTKPSVNQADLEKQIQFTKEFGIEG